MNYKQKYFDEIFENSIIDAYENGLISNSEDFIKYITNRQDISNYYVMTLGVIADSIEDVYYDMTDVYESNDVNLALGVDLDNIGEIIGCPRPQATKSGVILTFTLATEHTTTKTIPQGMVVRTQSSNINGSVAYKTMEDGVVPVGSTTVEVYAESVKYGTETRVLSNTLTSISEGLDDIDFLIASVTNKESSYGGNDAYNDEEYRLLLKEWVVNNTRGSKASYDRYFSEFNGLESYKLIPNWNGSGTLKIVLEPGYPYQLQEAYDDIVEEVCQLPDDITMWAPKKIGIKIYAKCNVDIDEVNPYSNSEKEEIKSRIVDAIKTYIDGDVFEYTGLGIGEDFIPYQLGVFLGQEIDELKNILFFEKNTKGEYVTANPVTITDEQIGFSEEITIIME